MIDPMIDWGTAGRIDTYDFFLVDPFTLGEIGRVDVDSKASTLDWGYETDNKLSGNLVLMNSVSRRNLIRVKHNLVIPGYEPITETLGTMFIENSGESAKFKKMEIGVNCYGTLWRHTQDTLAYDFARPKGYNIAQELKELIEADGGHITFAPDVNTNKTHTRNIFFEMNTNKATVLNTICGWAGWQADVDGDGYIAISNYVSPLDKPISFTFTAGANCIYVPGIEMEENTDDCVNRVVCYYQCQEYKDKQTIIHADHVVRDLDSGFPMSYNNTGRHITEVLQYPNVSKDNIPTKAQLTAYADDYLRNHRTYTRYLQIEHAGVPGLKTGDVVTYINDTDFEETYQTKAMITEMSMTLGLGGITQTTLKVLDNE